MRQAYKAKKCMEKGKDEMKKSKLETTIIVNDSTIWQLKNKNWYNIRDDASKKDLNWEKFNIVINNKEIGKYQENSLPTNEELTVSNLIALDFDDDGVDENFYFISNAFPLDETPENIFSIVFMEKSGVIYKMYNSIEKNKGYNGCKPYINDIIDVNDDDKYEIILTCAKYSVETPIDMLYTFTNNDFRIIISNQ